MPLEICSICSNMFIQGYHCNCDKSINYCYICFGVHAGLVHGKIPENNMVESISGEIHGKAFVRT